MFGSRKNTIVTGFVIGVAAAVVFSWAFTLNAESSDAAGGNWASVTLFPVVMGIFGAIFAFIQAFVLHAIKQLNSQMAQMEARMNERFALMENRFTHLEDRMDSRFAQMEERFTQLDARFTQLDNRIDGLENRMDARFAHVDMRFTQVDKRLDSLPGITLTT